MTSDKSTTDTERFVIPGMALLAVGAAGIAIAPAGTATAIFGSIGSFGLGMGLAGLAGRGGENDE